MNPSEQELLTTTIQTDLASGTKVYYKLVGKGVNKADFNSGAMSGSVAVGADGSTRILHQLKADKTTEGDETFRVEIFADKKFKNPLGFSDPIKITDTSFKATNFSKAASTTTNWPQVKLPEYSIDPITALSIEDKDLGTVWTSDVVYDINSSNFKKEKSYYKLDSLTGYWKKKEITDQTIIETWLMEDRKIGHWSLVRNVWLLDPENSKLARGNSNNLSDHWFGKSLAHGTVSTTTGERYDFTDIYPNYNRVRSFTNNPINNKGGDYISWGLDKADEEWFRQFGDGKYFGKNWYLNPFEENLI